MGLREFVWVGGCVTALAAWWASPPGGDARVYTNRRNWPLGSVLGHLCTLLHRCGQVRGRRSVHRLAKTASRLCFGALVYTVAPLVATRAASGGTSAPTTMARRWHPLGDRLPLGRKKQLPRELRRR